jgi:hypothetical protein
MLRSIPPGGVISMRHRAAVKCARHRPSLAFAIIWLFTSMVVGTGSTQAGAIAPTGINVVASTDNTGLGGAVPNVLVQAGAPFTLDITLSPAGASFNKDTLLALTPGIDHIVGGDPHGTFSPSTVSFPAGQSSETFAVSYSAVDNGVILTASVAAKNSAAKNSKVARGATQPFDVLKTVLPLTQGDTRFPTGVGVGNNNCGDGTSESECGIVVLPNGIQSPNGALTLGACTPNDLGCTSGSQVVQFVAELESPPYTSTSPATLIFRCSKELCRNTNNGIKSFTVKVSQSVSGPLDDVSQPCIAKGVANNGLNDGETFCTDYVQSHRDNSGDVLLYLLFTQDMRGST